jgi:hypothetical protein
LIHCNLAKTIKEGGLMLDLLYIAEQDFHPDEAGALD